MLLILTKKAVMVRVLLLLLFFFSAPLPTYATTMEQEFLQEENESSKTPERQSPLDSKALLIKTVVLLAGLVGMLYGGAYLVKRMGGGKYAGSGSEGEIQLIERKFLSPKTSVWLISIKKTRIVVIEGQNGVAVHPLEPSSEKEIV